MTTSTHRRPARRVTAVARLILATTVALAAGAGVLAGKAGDDDTSLPAGLVRPAAVSGPDGGPASGESRPR